MNPVRLIKNFLFIFVFLGLAGFSFDSYAQQGGYYYTSTSSRTENVFACGVSSSSSYCYVGGVVPNFNQFFSSWGAVCGYMPKQMVHKYTGEVVATASCNEPIFDLSYRGNSVYIAFSYRSSHSGGYFDNCLESPDSPYCEAHCATSPTPSDCPIQDLEPDDPYCLDNPMNPLCSPEEPTPEECALGVGSQACCASYAYDACGSSSVAWWSAGYGLGGYVTSCSYACQHPANPSEPDPYDPPTPDDPDNTPIPPVSPNDPSNPSSPSDPSDPVSVDLSGVNERLEILTGLNTDGFNSLNQSLDRLDRNNQTGLGNVTRSIDSGFSDLGRRLDPSGSPSFNPNAFEGEAGFTQSDSNYMKDLLGVTGDESFGDLERTIELGDYSDDYTFTLPDSTCPVPRQIELSFGTFELSYEPMCEIFDYVGIYVVLTALFLTPIIVFRGL